MKKTTTRVAILLQIIVGLSLLPNNGALAQNVSYAYDKCGNRTSRMIVLSGGNKSAELDSEEDTINSLESDVFLEDMINDLQFRIYPNPTHGKLKVDFQGLSYGTQIKMEVYDMQGSVIKIIPNAYESNIIDLSSEPNGIYILRVIHDGKQNTWKIIKN